MPMPRANPEIAALIAGRYTTETLARVGAYFERAGTLRLASASNGLYPASAWLAADSLSGYQNAWVRDNVMVANYLRETRDPELATLLRTLAEYFHLHRRRFIDIIENPDLRHDPARRPHVRFQLKTLGEIPGKWAHAQNDALGYALWLPFRAANDGLYEPDTLDRDVFVLFPRYFAAIRYWEDADSGHWEEDLRVNNSSIGVVVAALEQMKRYVSSHQGWCPADVQPDGLDDLIARGRRALANLPAETPGVREADAALVFLTYPLDVVDSPAALAIVERVAATLEGPHGIKRYLGDSYWCQEYDRLLAPGVRTGDFSDRIEERNRLLEPGCEAQWCIFDPVLSVFWGRRYLRSGDESDLEMQTRYFNRALSQITPDGRCPELYYMRDARSREYAPNDHVPLLWTQANLGCALLYMERSAARAGV
jgi:hypothetical protein